ncbi:hypothetical protein [Neobacillus soli]|uniref:hypothetical protein n=1 Tax=Neobacillus soli TaxID=220688 RepID=UPI0008259806|nr:hypothetical protein [Neobacillus soli]
MQLSSIPQTGIRQVSKCFRLLYPLEDQLNSYIQQYVQPSNKISTIQVFFDTDINDDNYVKLLSLRDKILQVETSLIWGEFSKLDRIEQELVFIRKLHKVVIEVAKKYNFDNNQIELAFSNLLDKKTQEK